MSDTTTTVSHTLTVTTAGGTIVRAYTDVDPGSVNSILNSYFGDDSLNFVLDTVTTVSTQTVDTDDITPCPFTHAHTRHWCGHRQCRDS